MIGTPKRWTLDFVVGLSTSPSLHCYHFCEHIFLFHIKIIPGCLLFQFYLEPLLFGEPFILTFCHYKFFSVTHNIVDFS